MQYLSTVISVGATAPFSLLHMSDTHLTLADARDDERKRELAVRRAARFPENMDMLAAGGKFSREKGVMIVHTGDLIDFVSCANLDEARRFTDENDCFMAAGNHEFSLYVGEALENADYRNISLKRVQESFKNDIRFSSRIINGVNLVAIDNSYYLFEPWQLERLKKEVARGLPILLLVHVPLYSSGLCHYVREVLKEGSAGLMNVPAEKMMDYNLKELQQQYADAATRQAYAYITATPQIKAIITGHLHFDYEDRVTPTLPQYITGCGTLRELRIQ